MYCASDYRSMARRALKNFWWLAVGVTLLATVLGGGTSSLTVSFQNSDVSRYYPEAMRRFTHVLVPVASVLAMGQFVLRGSISIGHDRFCLKLVDEPGELSRVMGVLAKCGINVVYSYSMISTYIVLSTSEPERAQALLADEPVELISQEDIARIVAERAAKEA